MSGALQLHSTQPVASAGATVSIRRSADGSGINGRSAAPDWSADPNAREGRRYRSADAPQAGFGLKPR